MNLKVLKNIIIISGPARSGTSILGKVLGSCKSTEYCYEPETLIYIASICKKISKKIWRTLYNRYLTENLLRIITGRSINLKDNENSSINSFKSKKEIKEKLKSNLSEIDLEEYVKRKKISFIIKSPNLKIKNLATEYPQQKIVVIQRNHYEIINSILKKKWFQKKNYLKTFQPTIKIKNNYYPSWMHKKFIKFWRESNEQTKCAIYLLCCYEDIKHIKNIFYFNYKNFIYNPQKTTNIFLKKLGLNSSDKTVKILRKVRPPRSLNNFSENKIKKNINTEILARLEKYNF